MEKTIKIIFTICLVILVRSDFDYTKLPSEPLSLLTVLADNEFSTLETDIVVLKRSEN